MLLWLRLVLATTPPYSAEAAVAVARAGDWMARYTAEQPLNFDAVIVLALIRERVDTPSLALAFERANARLDRDHGHPLRRFIQPGFRLPPELDRKSTRLNSSHLGISYAVFCLKKKKQ